VLLSTPLHASSNFTVSVQLANKRGFSKKKTEWFCKEFAFCMMRVKAVSLLAFSVYMQKDCWDRWHRSAHKDFFFLLFWKILVQGITKTD
jgi:hypothetical protein